MKKEYGDSGLFFEIEPERLLSKDEIERKLSKCEFRYNNQTMKYLYNLYNLKKSALYVNEDMDDEVEYSLLFMSKFFRQLVVYNLYFRYKNMKIGESYFSSVEDCNYFRICSYKGDKELFGYDYKSIVPRVYLYSDDVISISERKQQIHNELIKLREELDTLLSSKNPYNMRGNANRLSFGNPSKQWFNDHRIKINRIENRIIYLDNLSDSDIVRQYNDDLYVHRQREKILEYFLNDCNLDLRIDFEEDEIKGNEKVMHKEYGYADVYIRNNM